MILSTNILYIDDFLKISKDKTTKRDFNGFLNLINFFYENNPSSYDTFCYDIIKEYIIKCGCLLMVDYVSKAFSNYVSSERILEQEEELFRIRYVVPRNMYQIIVITYKPIQNNEFINILTFLRNEKPFQIFLNNTHKNKMIIGVGKNNYNIYISILSDNFFSSICNFSFKYILYNIIKDENKNRYDLSIDMISDYEDNRRKWIEKQYKIIIVENIYPLQEMNRFFNYEPSIFKYFFGRKYIKIDSKNDKKIQCNMKMKVKNKTTNTLFLSENIKTILCEKSMQTSEFFGKKTVSNQTDIDVNYILKIYGNILEKDEFIYYLKRITIAHEKEISLIRKKMIQVKKTYKKKILLMKKRKNQQKQETKKKLNQLQSKIILLNEGIKKEKNRSEYIFDQCTRWFQEKKQIIEQNYERQERSQKFLDLQFEKLENKIKLFYKRIKNISSYK